LNSEKKVFSNFTEEKFYHYDKYTSIQVINKVNVFISSDDIAWENDGDGTKKQWHYILHINVT